MQDKLTEALRAIQKKLGNNAMVSDDYNIACDKHLAYLHDSVTRAKNVGRKIPSDTISWSGVTLYRYEVDKPTSDDCGEVARSLMAQIHGVPANTEFVTADPAQESALNPRKVTVQSDLKTYRRNEHANADIGEAYVVIPKPQSVDKVQFHFATVVAKSGGDALTFEGFAGTGVENWSFELNSQTNLDEQAFQSFHVIWGLVGVHTFVAKPKGVGPAPVTTGSQPLIDFDSFFQTPSNPTVVSSSSASTSKHIVDTKPISPSLMPTPTIITGTDPFPSNPSVRPNPMTTSLSTATLELSSTRHVSPPSIRKTTTPTHAPNLGASSHATSPSRSTGSAATSASSALAVPKSVYELKKALTTILDTIKVTSDRQKALSGLVQKMDQSVVKSATFDMTVQDLLIKNGLKLS